MNGSIPLKRILLAASLVLVMGGCTRVDRLPVGEVEPREAPGEIRAPAEEAPAAPAEALLDLATIHLEAGRLDEAAGLKRRALAMEGVPAARRQQALWSLAMIHLLPESPLHDVDQARSDLTRLEAEHGDSVPGQQARWLLGLLNELDRTRTDLAEQAEVVEQLRETVEQLRRIDLNRRPSGGGPVRPDSPHLLP